MKKVGILGGTFNPPHLGHLIIANEALEQYQLDEVWFMPSYSPPHKEKKKVTDSKHRLRMTELAIEDNPCFKLQPIEFEKEGTSYTFETMKLLKDRYQEEQFYFIIGGDMVEYLPKWYNIEELLELVTFIGVKRPHHTISTPYSILEADVPQIEISSSLIREKYEKQKSIRYFVPENVRNYIEEQGLYES
ncbi:nicotinate-nucleotide adenylyltransferase [Priestia endophytica]|uniref:nicotinate-nucleotide adenylyltransferase n=1 Tax=Priestia endophytica TaxID=135735 RepID=UPI002281D044|nr:nicotinate-nucleotide adenylyltransferase [Priestia endophytica]MCY8233567.1 nicotinate-nucleotide adenylyltransferase [Priestia endophytica]